MMNPDPKPYTLILLGSRVWALGFRVREASRLRDLDKRGFGHPNKRV